ncbi:PREDICTED: uncharacterized protein LOC109191333 [Ipomoea nil]|uniref:uncharacterized protein LOC109191333 n=1 Tax=Ipomoea nil TaxID=35883 RepID=UPI000901718E|nr:PREDICTED: uncharacterized protein LOC109191333 [Ipomoea nil]
MADGSVNSSERTISDAPPSSITSTVTTLSTAHHFISVKLTHRNFLFWRAHVVPFLNGYDLMGFIDGTNPCPPATISSGEEGALPQPNLAYHPWVRQDQALLAMLMSSLSDEVMSLASGHHTNRAMWTAVTSELASSSQSRSLDLIGQIQTLQQGDASVTDYIGHAQVLIEDLTLTGRHLPLEEQNLYVFRGVRPEFRGLVSSLNVRGTPVTLHELSGLLNAEEFVVGSGEPSPTTFSVQKSGQSRGGSGSRRGNGSGHGRGGRNGNRQPKCQLCGNFGHTAHTCYKRYEKDPQANMVYQGAPSDSSPDTHTWFPDTGGMNHATPNIAALSISDKYNGNDTLRVGDGRGHQHQGDSSSGQ